MPHVSVVLETVAPGARGIPSGQTSSKGACWCQQRCLHRCVQHGLGRCSCQLSFQTRSETPMENLGAPSIPQGRAPQEWHCSHWDQIILCCEEVCVCEALSGILGLCSVDVQSSPSDDYRTGLPTLLDVPWGQNLPDHSPSSSSSQPHLFLCCWSLLRDAVTVPGGPPRPRGLCAVLVLCPWSQSALSLPDFSFLTCALNKAFTGLVSPSFFLTAASS